MTAITRTDEDGYGAAEFDTKDGWHYLEIQVNPNGFKVYLSSFAAYRARRAEWVGDEARQMGAAITNSGLPPAILADFCQENAPATCDWDFDVPKWLRKADVDGTGGALDLPF